MLADVCWMPLRLCVICTVLPLNASLVWNSFKYCAFYYYYVFRFGRHFNIFMSELFNLFQKSIIEAISDFYFCCFCCRLYEGNTCHFLSLCCSLAILTHSYSCTMWDNRWEPITMWTGLHATTHHIHVHWDLYTWYIIHARLFHFSIVSLVSV